MNTVFCIQQKAHRNQAFQKTENSNHMVSAYDGTKGRMPFFSIKKTNSLLCSHKKDKKEHIPKNILEGMCSMKRELFFCQHFAGQVYESLSGGRKFCLWQSNAKRNSMRRV